MSLVKVWTDVGKARNVSLLAKIVENISDTSFRVKYLSKTEDEYKGCIIWRYEDETYDIDDEYITEYMMTDDEHEIGYRPVPGDEGAFILMDDDTEYIPSSDDETDDLDDDNEDDDCEDLEEEDDCVSDYEE